jgi:protein-tyrosine phosphatase
MAEFLLRERIKQEGLADWHVESAGTWTRDGAAASLHAVQVMAGHGLDISAHRSRQLDSHQLERADLILVMTASHAEALALEFPDQREKLYLLSEMKDGRRYNINDPYGGSIEEYQTCGNILADLIETGFERIRFLAEQNASARDTVAE